ncbi:helix-turn-helix domain-containing protein [Ornithinimicrobium tianjinense]|uniref:Uncharacterized protein n=1 Tax=Ornithinimicrobium tianjinense TaxID=1195761 RepID=A0A917BRZ1_9MICO|nr:helix-turn-helix domain-containing protein [Ornithinimicrobium tianjinense]GGF54198.1 hypothetical protein GCM10011366_22550 [Ornithinimicrobium tianjinense]
MSTSSADRRDAAVIRVRGGEPATRVAADVGVHPSTVRRWVKAATVPPTMTAAEPKASAPTDADVQPVVVEETEHPPDAEPEPDPEPEPEPEPSDEQAAALQRLHVLASAPRDAISRWGESLSMTRRYALVVAGWLLCLLLAWVAPDPEPLRPVLVTLHLLAMTVSFGSVMALDWHGLLWERRQRQIEESIRLSHALSPLIWAGLTVLFVTGGLLAPDLGRPLPWLKLVCVLVLALNGVATAQLRHHLAGTTSDGLRSLAPGARRKVVLSSLLSQACWLTAVVVGMATTLGR